MKLLVFSDLHLGAGYDHRRDALADTSKILDQIAELAQDVDLVLFGGDAFHRSKPSPAELHCFKRFCAQLERARVPMIALLGNGNHEAAADERSALELFASPWVHVSRRPEIVDRWAGVSVVTLPAVPLGRLIAGGGTDRSEASELAVDLLLRSARELYGACDPEKPRVLLLHWAISGATLPTGLPVDQLHEAVLPFDALEEIGFDALVAGHIHKAQEIHSPGSPPAFYCGSPMTMDFGEAVVEHGVYIVTIGPTVYPVGSSRIELFSRYAEFKPLADRSFVTVDVDLMEDASEPGDRARPSPGVTADDLSPGRGSLPPGSLASFQDPRLELETFESTDFHLEHEGSLWVSTTASASSLDETDLIAAAIVAQGNGQLQDAILRVRYTATEEQHRRVDTKALDRLIEAAGVHRLYGGYQWQPVRENRARVELAEDQSPLSMLDLWISAQGLSGSEGDSLRALTERLLATLT